MLKYLLPEIGSEGGVMISLNGLRHTMEFKNIVHGDLCYFRGLGWVFRTWKRAYLERKTTTTLLPNFNNPTMKSIEMLAHTLARMGKGCNALGGSIVSPLCH
jgi:hypothetical protein